MTWHYSNTSVQTTLSAPAAPGDTSITVASTSGLPVSFPFSLILDYQQATVEVVTVTNVVSTTLTVTRGQDGTSAQTHASGAVVVHGAVARDLQESQDHIAATGNIHGVGAPSSVVGTATAQVLTNKTISGVSNTLTNIDNSSLLGIDASKITGTHPSVTVSGATTTGTLSVTGASSLAAVTASGLATLQAGAAVSGGSITVTEATAGTAAQDIKVTGDTNPRLRTLADGTHQYGPGNGASDLSVGRTGAGVLTVTGAQTVTGNQTVSGNQTVTGNLTVSGIGQLISARKTSDQTVNNTTTLVSDSALSAAVVANAVYKFEMEVRYSTNSTANLKTTWTFPAGLTMAYESIGFAAGTTVLDIFASDQTTVNGFSGNRNAYRSAGLIMVSSTPGTLQFQWAQSTANVSNTIVQANSYLTLTRIA